MTGGCGFIGSHLVEALVRDGSRVIVLDNCWTGTHRVDGAEYVEGHTKDIATLVPERPHIVFHLGEYARTERSLEEPHIVWDFNLRGTAAVLEFCRHTHAKLVYAGSSTKFADNGLGRDQSPYAWSKAINSELVRNYGRWYGLEYAIAYFYNVYGEREISVGPYATLIARFKVLRAAGRTLEVTSPGTQRRNFTHVDDIVAGLILVGAKGSGDDFGLGAEQSYSVLEIAEMFGGTVELSAERPGNRMSGVLDVVRSKDLGWSATRRVEDHIRSFVAALRQKDAEDRGGSS